MKGFGKYIMTAVKGACMGAADVIPGVSGGTIAFIMGIYDDFVSSLASINGEAVRLLLKGQFKAFWKHINGGFLLSLVIGIGISVIALAGLMQTLLSDFPIQTWAFFFGLIVSDQRGAFAVFGIIGLENFGGETVISCVDLRKRIDTDRAAADDLRCVGGNMPAEKRICFFPTSSTRR